MPRNRMPTHVIDVARPPPVAISSDPLHVTQPPPAVSPDVAQPPPAVIRRRPMPHFPLSPRERVGVRGNYKRPHLLRAPLMVQPSKPARARGGKPPSPPN